MIPRITNVRHVHDYVLALTFSDGTGTEMDFRDKIVGRGGVFEPLEDLALFRQVRVDLDFGSLVWPNDVDFCPNALHMEATSKALLSSQ